MRRYRRAPPPCAAAAADRDRAETPRPPGGAPAAPWPCAQSRSAAGREGAPAASAPPAPGCPRSRPYREHQQQRDEGGKDQTEIAPDGEELQTIEPVRGEANRARY